MLHPDVTSGEHCRHSWHIEAPYLGTLSSPPRPCEARLEDRGCRAETGNIWDSDTLADEGTRWIWWEPAQPLHLLMRPNHCQSKKLMQIIHARLWFARGISTCLVSALPLCDPGRGYCWPQIAPAPGTGPQSDEGRPCYSYYYTTHHITGQRCCSWQPFRQNCTQKSEHKFILFCMVYRKVKVSISIFSTPFKCVIFWKITSILNSLPSIFLWSMFSVSWLLWLHTCDSAETWIHALESFKFFALKR